jgi:hypothetical protein
MTKILNKKIKGANRHWKNFIDKDYLGSHNLEKGEEMLLTIEKFVGEEEVKGTDGKATMKMVLYFKEDVPKMILNITNGNTIALLYGTHPEDWVGKKVQIFATPVKAFGKVQDALRIRDVIPKAPVDNKDALAKIRTATSKENLKEIFLSLSQAERNNAEVVKLTNELKAKYESTQQS